MRGLQSRAGRWPDRAETSDFGTCHEKVIEKLNEFFELLDIQVYDQEKLSRVVTPDFRIFEVGNDFDLDSFDSFINGIIRWFT